MKQRGVPGKGKELLLEPVDTDWRLLQNCTINASIDKPLPLHPYHRRHQFQASNPSGTQFARMKITLTTLDARGVLPD
jgi:hypothetical protein